MGKAHTKRNGQRVWPYCDDCGCRLWVVPTDWTPDDGYTVHHFAYWGATPDGHDARGCRCPSINEVWRVPTTEMYKGVF